MDNTSKECLADCGSYYINATYCVMVCPSNARYVVNKTCKNSCM